MGEEETKAAAYRQWLLPGMVAIAWVVVALALLPAYGPTWDCAKCEFRYGEALLHSFTSSDMTVAEAIEHAPQVPARSPHPNFVMEVPWSMAWPVAAVLSAASCRLFWTQLGWLPAVEAHHLPNVLFTALLVFVVVRFTTTRLSLGAGAAAGVLLLTSPRFFADSFNNGKDAPEACLYTLASVAGLHALQHGRLRDWLAAGALAGAAVAQKTNGIFLAPLLVVVLLALVLLREPIGGGGRGLARGAFAATVVAAATFFALSPPLWLDPIGNLREQIEHVARTGNAAIAAKEAGIPVNAALKIDWDGPAHALWTTPLATLLLAGVGLFASRLRAVDRVFLALGVIVPIGRIALPGMTNFDGIRHFEEFLPPLCVLAAAGLDRVAGAVARGVARIAGSTGSAIARSRVAYATAALALVAPGAWATVRTHPDGVCYYNALVGGLSGAQRRGVNDSTDYWCNTYWRAASWLRDYAEPDATLLVPIGSHVMRAIAPLRLRPDLHMARFNDKRREPPHGGPLYVCYVTRARAYGEMIGRLERESSPVHEIRCDGAPILKIHRLDGDAAAETLAQWRREVRARLTLGRVLDLCVRQPGLARELSFLFADASRAGRKETLRRLREKLPEEFHDSLDLLLDEVDPADLTLAEDR